MTKYRCYCVSTQHVCLTAHAVSQHHFVVVFLTSRQRLTVSIDEKKQFVLMFVAHFQKFASSNFISMIFVSFVANIVSNISSKGFERKKACFFQEKFRRFLNFV